MKLNLSADELLTTTRSVRKRLDFDRPVERAVVEECLEIALQAPTGSTARAGTGWSSRTPPRSRRSPTSTARNFAEYRDLPRAEYDEGDSRGERMDAVRDSADYLADHFHRVPLLLIPCLWGRLDNASVGVGAGAGARCSRRCGASCSPCASVAGLGVDDDPPA